MSSACKEQGVTVLKDLFHRDDDSVRGDEQKTVHGYEQETVRGYEQETGDPTATELARHFASLGKEQVVGPLHGNNLLSGLSESIEPLALVERGIDMVTPKAVEEHYMTFIDDLTRDKEKAKKQRTVPSHNVARLTSPPTRSRQGSSRGARTEAELIG